MESRRERFDSLVASPVNRLNQSEPSVESEVSEDSLTKLIQYNRTNEIVPFCTIDSFFALSVVFEHSS